MNCIYTLPSKIQQRCPFKNYCDKRKISLASKRESLKESRTIENIPANELDLLLSKFFIFVRKQNGTKHEPGILSCFQFFGHKQEEGF